MPKNIKPEITVKNLNEIHHHILENYEVYGKKDVNGEYPYYHIVSFDSNFNISSKDEEKNGLNVELEKNKYYYMETDYTSKLGTCYKFTPVDFDKNPIEKHLKDEENFIKETLKEMLLNIDKSKIEKEISPKPDAHIEEFFEAKTKEFKQKFINLIDSIFSKKDSGELINKIRLINNFSYLSEINEKIHYNDSILNINPSGIEKEIYDKKSSILEDIHKIEPDSVKYVKLIEFKTEIEKYHEYKEEVIKEINFNKALYHISNIETPMAIYYNKYEKEMKNNKYEKEMQKELIEKIKQKKELFEEWLEEETPEEELENDCKGKIKSFEVLINDINAIDIDDNENNFDNYAKSSSTKDQIIYNQAFEIYKTISECVSDNIGNFWIKDTDVNYLNRGYEFVEECFLNEDTLPKYENAKYELTREFKEKAEDIKVDRNKIGHRKDEMLKAYLLGMSKAFDTMNIQSLYSFTKDDLEKCKMFFSKLANGEKINEHFDKEDAIELKLPNATNLEIIVELLKDSHSHGNNVYVEFNGVKLYSADVTMDKALLEMVNSDKSTIDDSTKREYIIQLKENATKVDSSYRLDKCIEELKEYREKGMNVYTLYRDDDKLKLYSCDVTVDSAYLEVTGQTKEDVDKYGLDIGYSKNGIAKQKAEVIAQINSQIEQGKKFIYPEKIEDWAKCVESNIKRNFVKEALEIMEQLDKGESFDKIRKTLDNQWHNAPSYLAVTKIVFEFSKKGPNFYEEFNYLHGDEVEQAIEDKKKENAELEEKHKNDSEKDTNVDTSDDGGDNAE